MRRLLLTMLPLVLVLASASAAAASPGSSIDGLRVSPPILNFGRVEIGACDTETLAGCKLKIVTLTNTGSEPILISAFIYRGDVSIGAGFTGVGDCGSLPIVESDGRNYLSLAAGTSCTEIITATPLILGRAAGRIEVTGVTQFDVIAVIPVRAIGY